MRTIGCAEGSAPALEGMRGRRIGEYDEFEQLVSTSGGPIS